VEEELVDQLVDHAQGRLLVGDILQVLEDEHHPVLEGVDRVDVFLVFRFDLEEGAHEAHPLQVLRQVRVTVVSAESLKNVLYLLRLLALPLRQLTEPESRLVHADLALAQIFDGRLRREDGLCQELLIQVLRCHSGFSLDGYVLDLTLEGGVFGELVEFGEGKAPWKSLIDVVLLLVGENELVGVAPASVDF
jgi:hypothetical protein